MVCAAADTVRTEVTAEAPEICKVAGLKLQLSPEGRPEQDRVTGPLKPPLPVSERFNVPGVPLLTVTLPAVAEKAKLPVPLVGCATVMAATTPSLPPLRPAAM